MGECESAVNMNMWALSVTAVRHPAEAVGGEEISAAAAAVAVAVTVTALCYCYYQRCSCCCCYRHCWVVSCSWEWKISKLSIFHGRSAVSPLTAVIWGQVESPSARSLPDPLVHRPTGRLPPTAAKPGLLLFPYVLCLLLGGDEGQRSLWGPPQLQPHRASKGLRDLNFFFFFILQKRKRRSISIYILELFYSWERLEDWWFSCNILTYVTDQ